MAIATLLCLGVHGCNTVDGGAVELSWKLRPASSSLPDKFVDCDSGKDGTNPVTKIRLDWVVHVDGTDHSGSDEWPCNDNHGVTNFELPPGKALLSVSPLCETGPALAGSYIAPAAEQRRVILGETVSLGAVELVVLVSYCGEQPCICE
ncbi:MAG: hypothetical protein H0T89_19955 [Deltaproteobacteria bacterium]|nr:hypothetical protein [Deltaproteobacteria bacterium]MDQ3297108.1 hypothetical protein [Myxococcota bacterium]